MPKKITKGDELRQKLEKGVEQLADTVTITLGPKGRNVGLEKTWIEPVVLHDGVSVAKEIELEDPVENFGAQLVKQVSAKTADRAGDGTTTSTLLAYHMIKKGFEAIKNGANSVTMKEGMEAALTYLLDELKKKSRDIKTKEEMIQIATISSASEELGKTIGEAIHRVGKDGVVNVVPYEGMGVEVEFKEGMEIDKGYISSYFATNEEQNEAEIESPYILITDMVLSSADEMAKFLKRYTEETNRAEIVIIAADVTGGALSTLVINRQRSNIFPLAVFAPSIGERRLQILNDIAKLTGGGVLRKESGKNIGDIDLTWLGRADRIIANDKTTRIIGGFGDPDEIIERADSIREQIKKETSEFEKEKLQERLARLVSGAAIIKVGALTEVALSDRKERVIDAVEATKAAVAEGIVAGGGITLRELQDSFNIVDAPQDDYNTGMNIVKESLGEPFIKLLSNAGLSVPKKLRKGHGINVMTGEEVDLMKAGIIDPTRVTKEALQNAVSVAGALLTCEAVVSKIPEPKTPLETAN